MHYAFYISAVFLLSPATVVENKPLRAFFFFGRTFDLDFSQTVALRMREYALSRDSAYCLPMIYGVTQNLVALPHKN